MDRLFEALATDNIKEFMTCLRSSDFELDSLHRIYLLKRALTKSKTNFIETIMEYGGLVTGDCIRHAISNEQIRILEILLKYASDECKRNSLALSFSVAVRSPHSKKMLKLLLKNGHDIYINDEKTMYPLVYHALSAGNTDTIETLLFHGANPFYCDRLGVALIYVFKYSLSTFYLDIIVKYAVLHLHSKEKDEIDKFLENFHFKKARAYRKFAESCIAEANILRDLVLNSNKSTLFDFVVSQGLQLKLFIDNSEIIERLFWILSSTPLPIYKREILKKVGRNCILSSFHYLPHRNFCGSYKGKKVSLDMDCLESICKFLSKKDIISMWIAFFAI